MNVTFLIGNGFDLNLGLKTQYNDFLKYYTHEERKKSVLIEDFCKNILQEKALWSSAEVAFGEYTASFDGISKTVEDYCDCHEDFCNNLAKYLNKEQSYVNLINPDYGSTFISAISNLTKGFRDTPVASINDAVDMFGGGIKYNFLTFNYTNTLDLLHKQAKDSPAIGKRLHKNNYFQNSIGALVHVHGYVDRDMVLGVNDISQITNAALFENEDEEYLNQIIKRQTNQANEQNTDAIARDILMASDVIYVYGMAIGETDAIWWERICDVLNQKFNSILIVHAFDAPPDSLIRRNYRMFEKKRKNDILKYADGNDQEKNRLSQKVFITGANIFSEFTNLAKEHDTVHDLITNERLDVLLFG